MTAIFEWPIFPQHRSYLGEIDRPKRTRVDTDRASSKRQNRRAGSALQRIIVTGEESAEIRVHGETTPARLGACKRGARSAAVFSIERAGEPVVEAGSSPSEDQEVKEPGKARAHA